MLFYAITGLVNAITGTILGLFIYFKNRKAKVNQTFALFCLSVAAWSYGYFFWQMADNDGDALFWSRALMAGAIFIPVCYFHFILALLKKIKEYKKYLIFGYLIFIFFFLANFTSLFVKSVTPKFNFAFWPNPGILYHPFLLIWLFYVFFPIYLLIKELFIVTGVTRVQIKYILIGTIIGYLGGITNYFLWYDIPIPPVGNWSATFYLAIVAYAIIRYRLMDIRIVLGKGAVYLFSFGTVILFGLGLNFWNLKLGKPISMAVLGPLTLVLGITLFQIVFKFFEKLASRYFYYTFYSFQTILADLGRGLTRFLDLDQLSSLIVSTLLNTMKLDRTVILLRNPDGSYNIQKNIGFKEENGISLVKDNFLTIYLEKTQKPLIYEELSLIVKDTQNKEKKERLETLQANMKRIEASFCLPLLMEEKIIGIIVLGNKISGDPYSSQDIELLTNLSNQASIALQNAKLYSEVKDLSKNLQRRVEEQVKNIEKLSEMKSEFLKIVNHQLRTPTTIIMSLLSMLQEGSIRGEEKIKETLDKAYLSSQRLITILDDILNAQELVGERPGLNLRPCKIENLISKVLEHFRFPASQKNLNLTFEKPKKPLPQILLDEERIERALKKLIDNAILYTEKGGVTITTNLIEKDKEDFIEIKIRDTGIGLTEDDKKELFKIFSRGEGIKLHPNGSGLGLYIAKEYIEAHRGKIEVKSEGKDKGSTFIITLPVITEV